MTRKSLIPLLICFAFLAAPYSLTASQEKNVTKDKAAMAGRKLFVRYCSTCHGLEAKGDGPSAKALKKAPANLTKIEKENGKFPTERVRRVISGEDFNEAHGSREMPIWGSILRRNGGEGFAKLEIYNLTKYLESIQQ